MITIQANNFSGELECGTKYRVYWETDDNSITLTLKYYDVRLEQYVWIDLITKEYTVDNYLSVLQGILIEADKKWDIELVKLQIAA